MVTDKDREYMKRAVERARQSITEGGGPFGAVVANDEGILSEASNSVVGCHDPTAHAEILAIRRACERTGSHNLEGCTIYCSCEPCPMCLGAIYWAGIKRVCYASDRNDASAAGFSDAVIYGEMIKPPGQRSIQFIRIGNADAQTVFNEWNNYENKVPY
ncbi:MAG: nucleoside deaminase [Bacteroidales bacterium]|jgi:tRNA(Arg) A34 adenosine deaminase TadA|nr:nucleoside deaminase [Bacteroidales bacterium]